MWETAAGRTQSSRKASRSKSTCSTMRRAEAVAVAAMVAAEMARQVARCCRLASRWSGGSQMPVTRWINWEGFFLAGTLVSR